MSSFRVDPQKVKSLKGLHNEHRAPGNAKFDRMLSDAKRKGFKQTRDVVLRVNDAGEVHVANGNTHLAVARALKKPSLKARVEGEGNKADVMSRFAVHAARGGHTDEAKWKRIVASVKAGGKGGAPGQWSARKAQLATQRYQASGGGYRGPKTEAQKSLSKWTREDWGTKSGKPSTQGPKATGERYLPKKARESLTSSDYAATTRAKREGSAKGQQFVKQPKRIAEKTARYR